MKFAALAGLLAATAAVSQAAKAKSALPHIFMVVVDDFGWSEVGYHRPEDKGDVHSPTIDALVKEGVELNRHYVHMMCTPTRASFQSGRLPVHVTTSLSGPCDHNGAIPYNMTGVATQLKRAGYETHQVGKWDAGMGTPRHTPHGRGYDTSLNYFGHANWMWTECEWEGSHNNDSSGELPAAASQGIKDFWDTDKPASNLNGTDFEEWLFRDRMLEILKNHDQSKPLFLNYDSKVAHYPIQAPVKYQEMFAHIPDLNRRVYHAMVAVLDDNLKNITDTMKQMGMWENTLMVLSSDNGGYVLAPEGDCVLTGSGGGTGTNAGHGAACFNGEAGANNYPLRGGKYSMFEGGIRVNAFVSGGFIPEAVRGTKQEGMMHIADWYGTFCDLAGIDPTDKRAAAAGLPPVDSKNVWPLISGQTTTSPRQTILVHEHLLVHNQWKYVAPHQNMRGNARAGPAYPNATTAHDNVWNHELQCGAEGCLFDVVADPHEFNEISAQHPDVVREMQTLMAAEVKTIYSVSHVDDPACKTAAINKYGGFYGPWYDL